MNAIVIEGKEYHFKMAHPENTEEILSLYQSVMGTEGCTWDDHCKRFCKSGIIYNRR